MPLTGRGTPLLCGRSSRGKRRTTHLPMVPFRFNNDLTAQNGSTRFSVRTHKDSTATDLTLETDNLAGWPNSRCDLNRRLTRVLQTGERGAVDRARHPAPMRQVSAGQSRAAHLPIARSVSTMT